VRFRYATGPSWGDRRDLHPYFEIHRLVRFSYATTTAILVRPEGLEPPSAAHQAAALPLCYRRTSTGRSGGSRTHGLTVPNRARLPLRHTPVLFHCCGEQGSRTPRPEWATRVADGYLAPMQEDSPCWRKERESNPQGSSLARFRDGCHPHVGSSFQRLALLRYSGSGGNRDRRSSSPVRAKRAGARSATTTHEVGRAGIEPAFFGLRDRCNASVCYRPDSWPHPPESNRNLPRFGRTRRPATPEWEQMGCWLGHPSSSAMQFSRSRRTSNIEFRTQESNPDVAVQSRASCRWTSPERSIRTGWPAHSDRSSEAPGSRTPRVSWTTRLQRAPASLPV
jgi:hypothetical protein